MSFVVSQAGGRAIDGETGNVLSVQPERVHQKSPCFIGSPLDVAELETYLEQQKEEEGEDDEEEEGDGSSDE